MAKTFLYRFFGIGKLPANLVAESQAEGLLLMDEGIRGTVTYINFRGGGRISNWRRQWFGGAIVLTQQRLVAYRIRQRIIDVALDDPRLKQIEFSIEQPETFVAAFDAGLFQPDWKGRIEYRFRTPLSNSILATLRDLTK
jgi:hypothetical protein